MNAILIILGIVVVLALLVASVYNTLVSLRNKTEEAFSTMDVYLQKRHDLIPNYVETVKGYAKHESETFEKVVSARNKAVSATTSDQKVAAEGELSQALGRLFALAESYPELKANTNFLDLQAQLEKVETDIAQSRKYYNGTVNIYNTKTEVFPNNIVAGIFGFKRKTLFEVNDASHRENVRVQF